MNLAPPPKPDDYRSIRLSGERRDALMLHARLTLYTPDEERLEARAFRELYDATCDAVKGALPAKDFAVLRKYKHTDTIGLLFVPDVPRVVTDLETGAVSVDEAPGQRHKVIFCFCPRDVRAKPSTTTRTGCHRRPQVEDAPADTLIEVPSRWTSHEQLYDASGYSRNAQGLDVALMPDREEVHAKLRPVVLAWLQAKARTDAAREAVLRPLYSLVHSKGTLQAVAAVWPEAMRLADRFEGVREANETGERVIASARFGPPSPEPVDEAPAGPGVPAPTPPAPTPA